MTGIPLGHSISVELRRAGYRALGAFAWIQTAQFEAVAAKATHFLHGEELERFKTLKAERRQVSFLLGRYTAKLALETCLGPGFEGPKANIVSGVFTQPVVHYAVVHPIGVSISHSDQLACSVAYPEEHPMAIDVEEIDAERTKVMMTQIGREEGNLASAVFASKDLAATVVWAAKEALSKALRCGMTCPYELLEVCELEARDGLYIGQFKNFAQYKFQAWRRQNSVVTIVLPKKTDLRFSLPDSL